MKKPYREDRAFAGHAIRAGTLTSLGGRRDADRDRLHLAVARVDGLAQLVFKNMAA